VTAVKRGFTFTHATRLDPDWRPGPGQRYADGPKARMRVTRATTTGVWFVYDAPKPGVPCVMDRAGFEATYVPQEPAA
jgi:hypothetical protein